MSNVNVDTIGDSLMVQVVDLTDCTRGNLTCSIKEGGSSHIQERVQKCPPSGRGIAQKSPMQGPGPEDG